jgi:ketosteroid isomerase-like protein
MRKFLYLFITLFISTSIQAQTKKEKTIEAIVVAFNNAIIHTDSATLSNMVWDELTYGHSGAVIQDKAAFIHGVMVGPTFFKKIDRLDEKIIMSGKIATVRHNVVAQVNMSSGPGELKYGNMMVWKKKHGKWKLLSRQGYKLP